MESMIFDIKRFAVHDGPGIRTTLFFKGCPLKCVWCHNPESIRREKELGVLRHKCILCGACVKVCPENTHEIKDGVHMFHREKCVHCGKCVTVCRQKALILYGREISVEDAKTALLEDREFYETSGGGITLSGGECLMQADFCAALLKEMKIEGIHTAVDTSGFASKESIDKVLPYTDLFLYDIKALDPKVHTMCTGHDNAKILENLLYLDEKGAEIEIRIPYVPEFNRGEMDKIGVFLKKLNHIRRVTVLPYHDYAVTKYASLDMENTMPVTVPETEEIQRVDTEFKRLGLPVES